MNEYTKYSMHAMECYSVLTREEILTQATTWRKLEYDIVLSSEISQSQKDKHHMVPLVQGT